MKFNTTILPTRLKVLLSVKVVASIIKRFATLQYCKVSYVITDYFNLSQSYNNLNFSPALPVRITSRNLITYVFSLSRSKIAARSLMLPTGYRFVV